MATQNRRFQKNRTGGGGNHNGNGKANGNSKGNPPVQKFRAGRIAADVWQHEGKEGPWFSVTITRNYTDDDGNWHSSNSFGMDDLLVVSELSRQAWGWVSEELASLRNDNGGNGRNGRAPHNPDADNC